MQTDGRAGDLLQKFMQEENSRRPPLLLAKYLETKPTLWLEGCVDPRISLETVATSVANRNDTVPSFIFYNISHCF